MNCTRSGIWAPPTLERSEEHTSELQSRLHLVCRLLLEKKKKEIAHQLFLAQPTRALHILRRTHTALALRYSSGFSQITNSSDHTCTSLVAVVHAMICTA